jgi:hypothetical protein
MRHVFAEVDQTTDPDQETIDHDRLEDIRKYEPDTWKNLMEMHGLPETTLDPNTAEELAKEKRRTYQDQSGNPGITGRWEDL